MTEPIYKVFLGKLTEAFYALPRERRDDLLSRVDAALTEAGGRRIVFANSDWCSEEYHFFGVEEFRDLAAIQRFHAALGELEWLRYVDCITALGTKFAGEEVQGRIYQVFIGRMTEAWYALSKPDQDSLWQTIKAAEADAGARFVVVCNSTWSSERYQFFGVSAYPDLAAVQRLYKSFDGLGWMRYVDAISVLGQAD